jgi:exoribonuclease R
VPHVYIRCPDPAAFEAGFARLRNDFAVPEQFPAEVLADALRAIASEDHATRRDDRDIEFVAIDPEGSRDLDQVYHAERRSSGYRVHYGIADVGRFVEPGSVLDAETRARGLTFYAPDHRAPLHPEILSEENASLLAGADRPAVLWTLDLDGSGRLTDVAAERSTVRNREQLTYQTAQNRIASGSGSSSLLLLREVGELRQGLAAERGAVSLNLPGQELVKADGHYDLEYDEFLPVEEWNAQISLLTGMAAAQMMMDAKVGLVRTLPPPDAKTLATLRMSSRALNVPFPDDLSYGDWVSSLNPAIPSQVALMTQATHGLRGAGYQAFDGSTPEHAEHAAIASTYTHVTAPLRRLVDRFTSEIAVALSASRRPPGWVIEALPELPTIMQKARSRETRYERALVDFSEALILTNRVGDTFEAVVIDIEGDEATIQLTEPAVVATIASESHQLGDRIHVRLESTDIYTRVLSFKLV